MNLQPTDDAMHTAPQGVFRSTCKLAITIVAALGLLATAASAQAQPRGAKLSSDLRARLTAGDTAAVDVIVSGTPERIADLAAGMA